MERMMREAQAAKDDRALSLHKEYKNQIELINHDFKEINKFLPALFERAFKYESHLLESLEWDGHGGRRCIDGSLDMRCRDNKLLSKRRPEMVLEPLTGPSCKQIEDTYKAKRIEVETRL